MMVAVCNNPLCKRRDRPCRAGCIVDGKAEYCPCDSPTCPIGCDVIKIPIIHCKGGGNES